MQADQPKTCNRVVIFFLGFSLLVIMMVFIQHRQYTATTSLQIDAVMASILPQASNPTKTITVTYSESDRVDKYTVTDASKSETVLTKVEENPPMESQAECATRVPKSANLMMDDYVDSSCSVHNSEKWLNSPRFGNARDPLLTADHIHRMILDLPDILLSQEDDADLSHFQHILGDSLCYEKSRFMDDTESQQDDKSVRLWAIRLIYLAFHYHQHRLAIPEAVARSASSSCDSEMESKHNVGKFDFECGPDAKYLVLSLAGNGLGSNVRGGAVVALVAGMLMDRIVVFANNAPYTDRRHEWALASCDRHDYQCFFQAATPCTMLEEDITNSYLLSSKEMRQFTRKGILPANHTDYKTIRMMLPFTPQIDIKEAARKRITEYAHALVDRVPCDDPRLPAMRKGADLIMEQGEARPGYNYAAAAQKIQHAAAFYFLRPKPSVAETLKDIMDEIIPKDFDAERSIGLPIRGSDKCKGESECLTFDEHMEVASMLWPRVMEKDHIDGNDVTVVFTTESKSVVKEQEDFAANQTLQQSYDLNFNFVTNSKDINPDSGFIVEVTGAAHQDTADDAMISSLSSFKTQLLPRMSIGNCCSNFHTMLNDFLMEGCGAAPDNTFYCLQEYEDNPLLQVCCGWHHDCKERKKELRAELQQKLLNASNATTAA